MLGERRQTRSMPVRFEGNAISSKREVCLCFPFIVVLHRIDV